MEIIEVIIDPTTTNVARDAGGKVIPLARLRREVRVKAIVHGATVYCTVPFEENTARGEIYDRFVEFLNRDVQARLYTGIDPEVKETIDRLREARRG